MRNSVRLALAGVGMAFLVAGPLAGCSSSGSSTSATGLSREEATKYNYTGEVYLLRGLANVFSTGLDDLNVKFRRRGINSRVDNHSFWQAYADDIVTRAQQNRVSYPIIIMGHSLGGNASVQMARYLGERGVKVSYVAAFDPTITTEPGPNVDEVVNYFIPNQRDGAATNVVKAGPGFTGQISNVDVTPMAGVDHFNVEKNPDLQVRVMTRAISLMTQKNTAIQFER